MRLEGGVLHEVGGRVYYMRSGATCTLHTLLPEQDHH